MAKFNIEVELDWMDEEAYSIDDELRERIVKGVENALLEKATNEAVKAVDNKIAEKILEAEETIDMALHNYKKDSTGKEKIVTPDGEVVVGRILVGERGDGAGYISHFASCKKYRR